MLFCPHTWREVIVPPDFFVLFFWLGKQFLHVMSFLCEFVSHAGLCCAVNARCPTYISQTDFQKKSKFDSVTADLISELHWLPIKQPIDYKILALVYKALHGQVPSDVTDMLQITTRRQLRSSCSDGTIVEPRTRCVTFGERTVSAYVPRLWNRLPGNIKDSTFEQFKKLLKSHLFKTAYHQ